MNLRFFSYGTNLIYLVLKILTTWAARFLYASVWVKQQGRTLFSIGITITITQKNHPWWPLHLEKNLILKQLHAWKWLAMMSAWACHMPWVFIVCTTWHDDYSLVPGNCNPVQCVHLPCPVPNLYLIWICLRNTRLGIVQWQTRPSVA